MKYYFLFLGLTGLIACTQAVDKPFVKTVYPTSQVLPENLLRLYIQFSQAMKTSGNIEKIKLLDAHGAEVPHVFFNNVHELWNREQTQLTLLLDPARVKTGLQAHTSLGRALEANKKYTLIIEGLEDVNHHPMARAFRKDFTIERADTLIPEPKNWKLTIPKGNTKNSFIVSFPHMLDYQSLLDRLILTDRDNKPIEGHITIKKQETQWHFQPQDPWEAGEYMLHIHTRLEDPAGNNLNGLFDHKIGSLKYKSEEATEKITFTINDTL